MNTVTKTTTHLVCPSCHEPDKSIDHLKGQQVDTSWYCDHCGIRYEFRVMPDQTVPFIKPTGERLEKALVLLRHGKVGIVVEGTVFHNHGQEKGHGHEYFYDEHTCPTNYMRYVRAVIDLDGKDVDPHGIFQYVTTLPWDEKVNECNNDEFLTSLIPLFLDPPVSLAE